MKKYLYPFIAFFLALFVLVSINQKITGTNDQGKVLSSSTTAVKGEEKVIGPEELDYQYRQAAKSIVSVINALVEPIESKTDLDKRLESINRLDDVIYEIRVPSQYRDLHIQLVAIIDSIKNQLLEQTTANISNNIDFSDLEQRIKELTNEYPWL